MTTDIANLSRRTSAHGGIELHHQYSRTVLNMSDNDLLKAPASESPVRQAASKTCTFWNEFPTFVPRPTAPFMEEFNRLANQEGWGKKKKRGYLVKALTAEIDFHSDGTKGLVRWQHLCQELGLSSEPESNTKCKKVRLKTFVNYPDME